MITFDELKKTVENWKGGRRLILDLLTCVCIAGMVILFVVVVGAVVILAAAEVVKRRKGRGEWKS